MLFAAGFSVVCGLAWLQRPSAIAAHPDDLFPAPVVVISEPAEPPTQREEGAKSSQEKVEPVSAQATSPAKPPLDLNLHSEPAAIPTREGMATEPSLSVSTLNLDNDAKPRARADVPKIKFFDSDYGTLGFSSRRWVSPRFGIEAGVGITEGETLRERSPAAGVGLLFSFD